LTFLKIWVCEAYIKKLQLDKVEPKSEKYIFVGYPREIIGYTFYHPAEHKTFVAKTRTFLEKEFLAKGVSGRKVELEKIVDPSLKIPSSYSILPPLVLLCPPSPFLCDAWASLSLVFCSLLHAKYECFLWHFFINISTQKKI
jgi:hypothetical protein